MGVITDAWVTLPTTRVDLIEGFTTGVEPALGGGKAMGCVDIISNSMVLGGITSQFHLSFLLHLSILSYWLFSLPCGIQHI